MNISKLIPLSIKQTWIHYQNLGSPTSYGHNSLTVRSYVMFNHRLKQGWNKDAWSWINYWGIMEDTILKKKDTIKKTVKSKFKEKMWCDKELEEKRKLRYYKNVINPNLEDQNDLFVLPSVKKKISIAKIRTNSHKLHSEIGGWSIPKTPWDERVCHLWDTKKVEYEKHFLLDFLSYTHIRYHFQNICHTTNLSNLLTQ
jgi:hypothetical protein